MSKEEKLIEEVDNACKDFLINFKRDITFAQMRALMVEIHDSCEACRHTGGKDCKKCKMIVVHGDKEFKIDGRTKKVEEVIDLDIIKKVEKCLKKKKIVPPVPNVGAVLAEENKNSP